MFVIHCDENMEVEGSQGRRLKKISSAAIIHCNKYGRDDDYKSHIFL
jgi:hypothetical protein